MVLKMNLQPALSTVLFPAICKFTDIGFLSGVYALMHAQVTLCFEPLAALVALEWSLLGLWVNGLHGFSYVFSSCLSQ